MSRRIAYFSALLVVSLALSGAIAQMTFTIQGGPDGTMTVSPGPDEPPPNQAPPPENAPPSALPPNMMPPQMMPANLPPNLAARGPASRPAPVALLPEEFKILQTQNIFSRGGGRGRGGPGGPGGPGSPEAMFVFRGVVLAGDNTYTAFFENTATKKSVLAAAGDPIGTGRIQSIDLDKIMYEAGGSSRPIAVGMNLAGVIVPPTPTSKPSPGPAGRGGPGQPGMPGQPGQAARGGRGPQPGPVGPNGQPIQMPAQTPPPNSSLDGPD